MNVPKSMHDNPQWRDVRAIDRVPCELGLWVNSLGAVMTTLGGEGTKPLHPLMITATLHTARIVGRMMAGLEG